ncbi:MSMEG_0570 family nitrogen starvation response protein [Acidocella facilis]|uniref:MSMEG_0570 family nitrogen starvation response protein n=1 Tax=Acidocella facilis TaxID=525 RepID=UPI001F18D5DA|nr:MSMEG_0570 family nitrogen starvation response protein [Acidocella facilis]
MPEMWFDISWPDGREERCYSPSLIVRERLTEDTAYALPAFMARAEEALREASARVQAKYGFPCSRALGQIERLQASAKSFEHQPGALVRVRQFLDKG